MKLTLEEVKGWLRVDYDEDDNEIQLLIDNAYEYVRDSVDDFDTKVDNERFQNKAKLVMRTLITNWYDTRDYTELNVSERVRYTIRSIIEQMKHGDYSE